jgi:lipopolysaccharide export system protein LptA
MKIYNTVLSAAAFAMAVSAQAQNTPARPLSEGQLLKTLDALGTGDPLTKAPLSIGDTESGKRDKKAPETTGEKKPAGATEITAKEASFDQKSRQAVFAGDVVVKNPEFTINCDKLTAFLKADGKQAGATAPKGSNGTAAKPTPAPPPAPPGEKKKDTGGLEKAIAEGNVTILQEKVDAEGNLTRNIGRSKRAVFESATGDVILTGRPEVQQGINTIVATDENTVITLNREGRMNVKGPHKTVIKDAPENPTPNAR